MDVTASFDRGGHHVGSGGRGAVGRPALRRATAAGLRGAEPTWPRGGDVSPGRGCASPVPAQTAAERVVERVVEGLSPAEQQDLAAKVVQGLDTPAQQRAAAEGVVGALPTEAKQDLAATVVQRLDTPQQQRAAAEAAVEALPTEQRQQLAEGVLGIPDRKMTTWAGQVAANPGR
jgi:hypothetical protein